MKKITFEEAVKEYLNFVKLKKKRDTYETIERRIRKHLEPFFKNQFIAEISMSDIIKWQLEIEKLGFKYNYKSSLYYSLSNFYLFCNTFYGIDNIVKKVGNFKNNEIQEKGCIWTYEEFNKFINCIDSKKYHLLFNLLYFTGMRKGELLALKWEDINLENGIISINKTITRQHIIQTPKTKSSNRTIMVDKLLLEELKEYSKDKYIHDFIFNISFTQLLRIKNKYCDKANVKRIKLHEFRHSHACLLFMNDVPIDEISHRLGHSKISITTDTYLKYLPRNEKRVINTLNSLRYN